MLVGNVARPVAGVQTSMHQLVRNRLRRQLPQTKAAKIHPMRYPSTRLASALQLLVRNQKARLGIDIHLDHRKLQTVLFFVHAKALCTQGRSVFVDRPIASADGPIFQAIHDQLHSWGDESIVNVTVITLKSRTSAKSAAFKLPAQSDVYVWTLLETALEDFGHISNEGLMAATQAPDGPWARTRARQVDVISDMDIVSCL